MIRNIFTLLIVCVILSGCSTFSVFTKPIERTHLDIQVPAPLKLRSVDWKVVKTNNKIYFSLDSKNFGRLTKNTEDVQNRLYLQTKIIEKQQEFYETPIPKSE